MHVTVKAALLDTGCGVVRSPLLVLDDGYITAITTSSPGEASPTHDFSDALIVPGFLDVHVHGAAGHDVMEASSQGIDIIARFLAQHGTAKFLATTVTASLADTLKAVDGIARQIARPPKHRGAKLIGIHLEGPFVSHTKRGVHPSEHILAPTPEHLEKIWQASRGTVSLMTIAPELPGALETIRCARCLGIKVSLGHSDATAEQTWAAIQSGAVSATHTFNAMRQFDHREPGILGVVLDSDALFAEIICDGIHNSPEAVRLFHKAKGARQRGILVTDSMSAAGMSDGNHRLGGLCIQVTNGVARSAGGSLAGSVLTLEVAVKKFADMTGCSLGTAAAMASLIPAKMLGIEKVFDVGCEASFNIFDSDGGLLASFIRGTRLSST